MVGADAARITQAMEQLTELDFIAARAYLAQQQKAVRPVVNIGGGIEIAKGRHPLLDPQKVVPLLVCTGSKCQNAGYRCGLCRYWRRAEH